MNDTVNPDLIFIDLVQDQIVAIGPAAHANPFKTWVHGIGIGI
jgi:hypothetical protein